MSLQSSLHGQHLRFPTWQHVYDSTLKETDIPRLFTLVEIAEATILMCREALPETPANEAEQQASRKHYKHW
jgi:hypothetical protein